MVHANITSRRSQPFHRPPRQIRSISPRMSYIVIPEPFVHLKRFSRLSKGPATTAFYQRAPRRGLSTARLTRNNDAGALKADISSVLFAGDGNAGVNSRRVPLMCQEQTFPSRIYAGTPGMQMRRVVLRRSLLRAAAEYNNGTELLTKLN